MKMLTVNNSKKDFKTSLLENEHFIAYDNLWLEELDM